MKKTIKKIIYAVNRNPLSRRLYKWEINKRLKLEFTDVEALSKNINIFSPFTNEIHPINDWYGHAKVLKDYVGLSQKYQFKFIIEHGLYLSKQIADVELESTLPTFITQSKYRVNIIREVGRQAFAIGPLIHYAPHYLTQDQIIKEKKRLGKTLLFFPSHSILGAESSFNTDWSYKQIQSVSKGFDSIRVCLYWKDILLGAHKYYKNKGIECITAGHILDPLFLSRLKSIIETADLTISNDASSALSYCIYMNKPHIIFYQRAKMEEGSYYKKIMTDYWKSEPYNLILKEFSKIQFAITAKQRELMNYYCGLKEIKSKKELLKIIEQSEKIYREKTK